MNGSVSVPHVFKYPLQMEERQSVEMPQGARILSLGDQRGVLCLWAVVIPDAPKESRWFHLYGTGQPIEATGLVYVGSVQLGGGSFVWHVFEEGRDFGEMPHPLSGYRG